MYTLTSSAIGDKGHFQKPLSRFNHDQISAEKNTLHTPLTSASLGCKRRGAERMDGAVLGACAERGRGATGTTAEAQRRRVHAEVRLRYIDICRFAAHRTSASRVSTPAFGSAQAPQSPQHTILRLRSVQRTSASLSIPLRRILLSRNIKRVFGRGLKNDGIWLFQ
jgi:hypothetical protein